MVIEQILNNRFSAQRDPFEHQDRLYPTYSSVYVDYGKYKKLQGKCMRASYYSCNGFAEESNANIDLSLQQLEGEYIEKLILDVLHRQSVLIDSATKFEIPKYNIYGKLDGIIQDKKDIVGLEIKSIGSNKYTINDIWGSSWNSPAPRWQNLLQTLIYCYAFRGIIPYFILFYIRRDNGQRKEFKISIEPIKGKIYPVIDGIIDYRYTINDILIRYSTLRAYIIAKIVPPMEYQKVYPKDVIQSYYKLGIISKVKYEKYNEEPCGDFECMYCSFRKRCDGELI